MTIERALTTAAGASGPAVYVEDVFSTYLYTGTGATNTITNGIDLSTKGGMVWIKSRSSAYGHTLFDTSRGANKQLQSDTTGSEASYSDTLTSFNSNGFTLGSDSGGWGIVNYGSGNYASWTFRKQKKFFDIVTWTGDGASGVITKNHSLGSEPGMIIFRRVDVGDDWNVYHRSTGVDKVLYLQSSGTGASGSNVWALSASTFSIDTSAIGGNVNAATYVAYLFAHDAGGFGASGTDSIVSCGSFSSNSSGIVPQVDLGWEPQYLLIKATSSSGYPWAIYDNMRGLANTSQSEVYANTSGAESSYSGSYLVPNATGFSAPTSGLFGNSTTFIYLAIRRGPMKTPTDATKVFAPVARTGTDATATVSTGFAPDTWISALRSTGVGSVGTTPVFSKLIGPNVFLATPYTNAQTTTSDTLTSFTNTGITVGSDTIYYCINGDTTNTYANWAFVRAPGFFDVVCYTGTGSATTVAHNLGVVPELMIVKRRNSTGAWPVYSSGLTSNVYYSVLNTTAAQASGSTYWNSTTPTSSVFSIGTAADVNTSGGTYVAYLFATCPGVQYINSYVGDGTTGRVINCGFLSGARYVCIKATSTTGNWWVFDSSRGIVSASDPVLALNSTAAEITSADAIDPSSSGFIVNEEATCSLNASGVTYLVWAIA